MEDYLAGKSWSNMCMEAIEDGAKELYPDIPWSTISAIVHYKSRVNDYSNIIISENKILEIMEGKFRKSDQKFEKIIENLRTEIKTELKNEMKEYVDFKIQNLNDELTEKINEKFAQIENSSQCNCDSKKVSTASAVLKFT